MNKTEFEKYFSVDEIIQSGGGRSYFKITEILDDRVRIQPTESKTSSRLRFDKLTVIIDKFVNINPKRIEKTVGDDLKTENLQDTQNESYLYGVAKEYLKRKNIYSEYSLTDDFDNAVNESIKSEPAERKSRLKSAPKKPEKITIVSTGYKRNPDVVAEVLLRANGKCECCKLSAPFNRAKDGTPYLEVHHKVLLSENGEDTVENAIAICPNCHRKKHFGVKS